MKFQRLQILEIPNDYWFVTKKPQEKQRRDLKNSKLYGDEMQ